MRFLLLACAAAATTLAQGAYSPITQTQRLKWAVYSTAGLPSVAGGAVTSAISTAQNNPREYGPHWEGYGKRQALRLSGAATSNLMEAELGAMWGEDPRYRRLGSGTAGQRAWHAVKHGFTSYDRNGNIMPAYARFIAVPASNVIANAWRPDSQHRAGQVMARVSMGFVSHIVADAFAEFWPDLRSHVFHKK